MKISLPDGNWASLRDPKKVSERRRRPIMRAFASVNQEDLKTLHRTDLTDEDQARSVMNPEFVDLMQQVNDLLIIALVDEWSFDAPIEADSVLDLDGETYDALQRAVAPFLTEVMPDFDVSPDPKAPTGA
jgi:hypothetical protein